MDTLTDPMLALGLSLVALALLGALLLERRRRRRRSAAAAALDLLDTARAEAESPKVRALRAQVRALEEALESAAEPEPAPVPVDTAAEATYRRQVGLAVRAVGLRTSADDDPRHVVARVAAAIQRLDDHDPAGRPVLPGTPGPVPARSLSVAPLAPVAVESAAEPAAEPATEPAVTVEPEDEPAGAADVVQPEPEVVLPVPPPAPAAPRRGRRRLRHTAA